MRSNNFLNSSSETVNLMDVNHRKSLKIPNYSTTKGVRTSVSKAEACWNKMRKAKIIRSQNVSVCPHSLSSTSSTRTFRSKNPKIRTLSTLVATSTSLSASSPSVSMILARTRKWLQTKSTSCKFVPSRPWRGMQSLTFFFLILLSKASQ